jgi:hypothetical protein
MNIEAFLTDQRTYFNRGYKEFCAFGGPCVYFHRECLRAGSDVFLSERHVEMLYATLTAWGMHRMGRATRTKLVEWDRFRDSLLSIGDAVQPIRELRMLGCSENDYRDAIAKLHGCYTALRLSMSNATIVVNSKALHHLLPNLIPPIDRQYTVRFFRQHPSEWLDAKRRFTQIPLPASRNEQFELFGSICMDVKRLADRVDRTLFDEQLRDHGVSPPKAIDNAIVSYVATVAEKLAAT